MSPPEPVPTADEEADNAAAAEDAYLRWLDGPQ